jgi:hypothetical protein
VNIATLLQIKRCIFSKRIHIPHCTPGRLIGHLYGHFLPGYFYVVIYTIYCEGKKRSSVWQFVVSRLQFRQFCFDLKEKVDILKPGFWATE